jgi:hypothetical protein
MTEELADALHFAEFAVIAAEHLARAAKTAQAAAVLVAARRLLCEVELVAEMERDK